MKTLSESSSYASVGINPRISRRKMLSGLGVAVAAGASSFSSAPLSNNKIENELQPFMPTKIIIEGNIAEENKKAISSISPQINIVNANSGSMSEHIGDAEVVFGMISPEDFKKAKKLKWVQCPSAGVEHLLFPEMIKSEVVLTNAKGCYAPEIAEHVFGLLFGLTRGIAQQIRLNHWGEPGELFEFRGKTMGIVGLGGIGREIARRAKGMDMQVIACDILPMQKNQIGNIVDEVYLVDGGGLTRLLQQADVVVSAAPHTPKSEEMFGEKEFGSMKKGSYFINISRGKLVQTPALIKVLKDKHLAGAGLDVTNPEPLPSSHELWKMPNVIITSHIAGRSQFARVRTEEVFTENIRRLVAGLPLLNQVDKAAGY